MRHRGLHTYRFDSNPNEKVVAKLWDKMQANSYTLEYLLSEDNRRVDISKRDMTVAATVIQWLGSPVGQSFLDEVQEVIDNSKE